LKATIQNRLSRQLKFYKDNAAIKYKQNIVLYSELDQKSDVIARRILGRKPKKASFIALLMEDRIEFIATMIGILKAGCVFVPIDSRQPAQRIESILKLTDTKFICVDEINYQKLSSQFVNNGGEVEPIGIDQALSNESDFEGQIRQLDYSPEDQIYVYFTSGTAGEPKAIVGKNGSLVHFVDWEIKAFNIGEDYQISQISSVGFDASLRDIFVPLCAGGTICIPDNHDELFESNKLVNWIERENINLIHCTPSIFRQINVGSLNREYFANLKYILLAGEKINPQELANWYATFGERIQLVNLYGATETTMIKTIYPISRMDIEKATIPIGKPIAGARIIILDKYLLPCQDGDVGELFIRTPYRTFGYYNNPELNREKFIVNPFNNDPNDIIYRTGDLGRMLPDGNLELLGRIDRQVKIRGIRIELSEIENVLLNHAKIKEAVVVKVESGNQEEYLCAYWVENQQQGNSATEELSIIDLHQYLMNILPGYLIPRYFIKLPKMPVTTNGKLDYRALPEPAAVYPTDYEAPHDEVEEKLVTLWQEVLENEKIGVNDNLFALGGHSLNAITLVSRIYKTFNKEITLKDLFKHPNIKELANLINQQKTNPYLSIPVAAENETYPLSSAQKRLYVLYQLTANQKNYNMSGVISLEGELDEIRVEEAFRILVMRHEALRTSFVMIDGEPAQQIHLEVDFQISCYRAEEKELPNIMKKCIRPFDLSQAPLFRASLIRLTGRKHILVYDTHHIICDETSMDILMREFISLYNGKKLPDLRIQYKDFSKWQNELLGSDKIKYQEEYWLRKYQGEIPVLNLLTDYARTAVPSFEGGNINFSAGAALTKQLKKLATDTNCTVFMVLLATFNLLLSKYTGQEDIIIGTAITNRSHLDLENVIGMFVNTLAIRNTPKGEDTFRGFLDGVRENALAAYDNQDYPFEELVNKLNKQRDLSRNSLFDIMFVMNDLVAGNAELDGLRVNSYPFAGQTAKFDLTLKAAEIEEKIVFEIEYRSKLFKVETVRRMKNHFLQLLAQIVVNPALKLSEIEMISKAEKHRIINDCNDTQTEYPKDKTIHQLFEEQVEKTPDNIAIVFENRQLTYRELNAKSNQLARTLRNKGVKPDGIVAIMVEHSLEMVVGILGILKAGGAYLPIDPDFPKERVQFMLEDSQAEILLTQSQQRAKDGLDCEIIDINNQANYSEMEIDLEVINQSIDLAYVIYTSGSTGKPKGVQIQHQGIANLKKFLESHLKVGNRDRVLQFANITFDASVWEICMAILTGATLHIVAKDIYNYREFEMFLNQHKITIATLPPNYAVNLNVNHVSTLRKLILAGSAASQELVEKWRSKVELVNAYGPTETTICATTWNGNENSGANQSVPVGKPIYNHRVYIINNYNQLQPVGVAGELCISGVGLARGYLNLPELTAEKFVENPFVPGDRMYRTGDLARMLPDGNIEFLGRLDHQVKIRGFRIELGEIESQLLKHPQIKETVVVDKEDSEDSKYLCAYFVGEAELTTVELRKYLAKELPDYMIPSYFIRLDKIPLTPNGKIDRKALPEPDGSIHTGVEYVAPAGEVEEKLAVLWQDILGVARAGTRDNFFELGGHSLKATTLVSRIHKKFNVEFPLRELFKAPTLVEMARYIQDAQASVYSAIEPVEEREYYPLSSAQRRLYILDQLEGVNTAYNMPAVMLIEGELDKARLEESFRQLITRHETLRTSFAMVDGEPAQQVDREVDFQITYLEATAAEAGELANEFIRPFDLKTAPLLRVCLIKTGAERHLMLYDMHHIIADGVSINLLAQELIGLYEGKELPELRIQYKDYAVWQKGLYAGELIKKQEEYWRETFKGEIPALNLPWDYPRPAIQSFAGDSIRFRIPSELAEKLNQAAKAGGATLYMILLAALNTLLSKYTGQEEIVIGSPIAGRPHADLQNMIGMFVNTLAMRNYPEGEKTFREFLKEVRDNALKAYENQDYPFEELVEKLDIQRDMSRNPLFDVMFALQNMDMTEIAMAGLKFSFCESPFKMAKFDLTFNAMETGAGIACDIEYGSKLFKRETIARLIGHYLNILAQVTENPSIRLKEIEILTEEERNRILYDFNRTKAEYPKEKTIHQLFEEQVDKTPEQTAVVFADKRLTYRELNEKTNQLARVLRAKGVKADSIVGIMVERSLAMIVGILGILKAGGAYLPINPEYPEERIKFMLEDSQAKIILTRNHLNEKYGFVQEVIHLENEGNYSGDSANLEVINQPQDLVYIIYTSGSTGKPKGVMVEQRNLVNQIDGLKHTYHFDNTCRFVLLADYTFDVSVQNIFLAVSIGAGLYIPTEEEFKDPLKLWGYLERHHINIVNIAPSLLAAMLPHVQKVNSCLKYMIVGGEAFLGKTYQDLQKKLMVDSVLNFYGPTETTINATTYYVSNEKPPESGIISIGKPLPNYYVYILDRYYKPVPLGIKGELYIGGNGLARGYLKNERLTAEKFLSNPFKPGERMYRTGDLVRWLPDGNIEFLGRIDNQVKIRGFRIELGEIESRLLKHELIKETVVVAKEDAQGGKYLCAYLVAKEELTIVELREHLSKVLPDYMIPSYFIRLERMPLTSNGKIDRKALPEPDGSINTGVEYVTPANDMEEKLALLWQDILGLERVGTRDNFFERGGHSLKATTLVSRIHKAFNVEFPLRQVFKGPTIAEMARYVKDAQKSLYASIKPVGKREYYPMSSAQKRLYILDQVENTGIAYNMPAVMVAEGQLDRKCFEESFQKLIGRHETLRTSFFLTHGEPVQKIDQEVDFTITYLETSEPKARELAKEFVRPFDLKVAPLLRVCLIKVGKDRHMLLFDMHHIIADGTSMNLLVQELISLYEGEELPELRIQYKDYAVWQKELYSGDNIKQQEEHWLETFKGEIPVLNMPIDYPRPAIRSFEGNTIDFTVGRELTKKLNKVAKNAGATLYMTLLAAFNTLLFKYTGQQDIVIGSPIAGRPHADLHNIIGMFANTLAMRNYPQGGKTFSEFLKEVKETALKAYGNQDYQFEELVDKLDIKRDLSRNPLFDVMFTLQNMYMSQQEIAGLKFTPYDSGVEIAKFDLNLDGRETDAGIVFSLEYCTKLFKQETITRMIRHFINVVAQVTANPNLRLSEIDMLTKEERNILLDDFNNNQAEYPKDKTIHQLFEEQAERTPDHIAVVFEDQRMTYKELNEKANRLGRVLRKKGVGSEDIVAIMMERSLEMIVGILGILKAGGAYLPIDPEYPEKRIKLMVDSSQAVVLLTQEHLIKDEAYEELKKQTLTILWDQNSDLLMDEPADNLSRISGPTNLLYVIYTSGSTGEPKGVMMGHRNLVNLLYFQFQNTTVNFSKKVLQFASISFDVSCQEIFATLLGGGQLHLIKGETRKELTELLDYIEKEKLEVVFLPPAYLKYLGSEPKYCNRLAKSVRHIIAAGEELAVPGELKKYLQNKNILLHNHYGPTETHVVTTYTIEPGNIPELPPIGKPVSNNKIYILNPEKQLQPIGIAGELYISGDSVGRGYLNQPEMTATRFMLDPFEPQKIMYRTGDLARWLPDGNIKYLGRIDHQVKIRGFRIEPGEIENQLLKDPSVKETVVVTKEDPQGNKYLCAYLVGAEKLRKTEIRERLAKELPYYMIPTYFVQLEKMPLNANGKIDRKALPEPDGNAASGIEYIAPTNEAEEKLVLLWQEILGIERVGIKDDFFELGGHSLKAMILVSRLHKEFKVDFSLSELFKRSTVAAMATYLKDAKQSPYSAIEPVAEREYYPLSSAQRRLYILDQLADAGTAYNLPVVVMVEGHLEQGSLAEAFQKLISRHEMLRTTFTMVEGEPVQMVHPEIDFKITYLEAAEEKAGELAKEFVKPFDLKRGPLLRVCLIEVAKNRHLVLFDMHHIISDGTSINLLVQELFILYEGKELPELRIQYKDFAVWQKGLYAGELIKKQEEYWLEALKGEIPAFNLPANYPRPAVQSFEGDNLRFKIDAELTARLNQLARRENSTLFMVLMAALNVLLAKCTGQEDIIVGIPIAGRRHADLEKIIGIFLNTLAIRNYPVRTKTFQHFLAETKENLIKAYENQDYPIEMLLDKLNLPGLPNRMPLFEVMFNMLNMGEDHTVKSGLIMESGLTLTPYELNSNTAKFSLELYVSQADSELNFTCAYRNGLFKRVTVDYLMGEYVKLLSRITIDPKLQLSEYEILSKKSLPCYSNQIKPTVDYQEFTRQEIEQSIIQRFEKQVEKYGDRIGVQTDKTGLTYSQLNQRANQIGWMVLTEANTETVALLMDHDASMIAGMLGVLKAGKIYVPLDPTYPRERLGYMLKDSACGLLVTNRHHLKLAKILSMGNGQEIKILNIDAIGETTASANLNVTIIPERPAYILYTSGSAGRPKGVLQSHRNVLYYIRNYINRLHINCLERISLLSTYCHDASVVDIYAALLCGAALYPYSIKSEGLTKFAEWASQKGITIYHSVPTVYRTLIGTFTNSTKIESVRCVVLGGETVNPHDMELYKKHFPANCIFVNLLGSSEASITMMNLVSRETGSRIVSVGYPIEDMQIYICNMKSEDAGVYEIGEITYKSEHLALGYWKQPELTRKVFGTDPFTGEGRVYRSGDLGRLLPDGSIEFVGRKDFQVKIRGYRIELSEIEAALEAAEGVGQGVAKAFENHQDGGSYLAAYYTLKNRCKINESKIFTALRNKLPEYMVPTQLIRLEKMPLTPNGKIDRKALPEPDGSVNTGVEYVAPENELEKRIFKIWQNILEVKQAGINDNFFNLGGHSIHAIMLVSAIYREFGVQIPLKAIFEYPTIRGMIQYMIKANFDSEYNVLLLNGRKDKNIFLFPAGGAFGLMYMEMVEEIGNFSCYAFDFIESNNRIKEYARIISEIQKIGPYILLGYSAGGNLAFEVAKELNDMGLEVSDLVLLDAVRRTEIIEINDKDISEEITRLTKNIIDGLKIKKIDIDYELMKQMALKKIEAYCKYRYNMVNRGVINTNIHLIYADIEHENSKLTEKKRNAWSECTTKSFTTYKGFGEHSKMLRDKQNVSIVRKIIND
jgi:tyrocidine synthetase-3